MKHKRQHYIPASYLRAWCDPHCPENETPYVWMFSKDGSEVKKKAPKNIFFERDLYTVIDDNEQRNVELEALLASLESSFSKLRSEKLDQMLPLSSDEHLLLCTFVAAMRERTLAMEEQWASLYQQLLDMGRRF
jgi:hypothetical protein